MLNYVRQVIQPRSQGLSSLPPSVFLPTTKEGRDERPWERGRKLSKSG